MSYKTILVQLDQGVRRGERLELAFGLAEKFDANLIGLFALSAPRIPSLALAEAGPVVVEAVKRQRGEAAQQAEREFRAGLVRHDGVRAEWRMSAQDALGAVRLHARYADLVVVGQPLPPGDDTDGLLSGFAEELVLTAGRPVLLVPYAGRFSAVGDRVLLAWNAGREAARAMTDALPLLARAVEVQVVVFDPDRGSGDHGEEPGADIGLYLARHGVKVTVARQVGAGIDVGEQILSRAADVSADLVVMGAYGHSRTRELILGGVTRTLLESMTVPVLMSH
jgi:nucleotide-binding universal stress UspA family protein